MNWEIWMPWLRSAGLLTGALVVGWMAQLFFVRHLGRWAKATESKLDDAIYVMLKKNVWLWSGLFGLFAAAAASPLPEPAIEIVKKIVVVLFLISLTWSGAQAATLAVGQQRSLTGRTMSLTQNVIKITVFILGGLMVLGALGIPITPLVTALGVGSLAVALALQDTLNNLFAGLYIAVSHHLQVGDYIQLDSGQEGYVTDITWRACHIRQLSGNMVIVPNAKLGQAIVINYYRPAKDLAVLVQVGVAYDSDLTQVERVTIEVGREVMRTVAGGVPDFDPFIRYHTFGDSAIQFSVILRGKEFTDRYLITHEFIKRLQERYRREGIGIPFPQRVVHTAAGAGKP